MSYKGNFYITTPIYYANDIPHIGHAYTTILADVLTRFYKLMGYQTFFLTGTDEHGQKVQQAAAKRGVDPQAQVDEYHKRFKELWEKLGIEYDHFIRTTDPGHKKFVQAALQDLYDRDLIYSKEYEGWYSVGEERFFSEDELVDGKDPISGKPVEWLSEKNYFFKMGSYQEQLIQYINDNPDFIQPEHRKNEVLGFLRKPLLDLCISRPKSRLSWGIELPFDTDFVTYVWFDALLNYRSGVADFKFDDGGDAWPASYHLIGKDILTTHSVYWPTMLMGMNVPQANHILAHGWWLSGESKMSKSSGNAVDPLGFIENHGVDAVRYYLMRDMVLGSDATFTEANFIHRINSDLANDLGNGLNRVYKFVQQNLDGIMPGPVADAEDEADAALKTAAQTAIDGTFKLIQETKLSYAIEEVMVLVRHVNKYLEAKAPWKLAKDESKKAELDTCLHNAAEAIRIALQLLHPVMPRKTEAGLAMLGVGETSFEDLTWGILKAGTKLGDGEVLFPRIEKPKPPKGEGGDGKQKKKQKGGQQDLLPCQKLRITVGHIKEVSEHPDADSLYVLKIDIGSEVRQVCAGLRNHFDASELQDKKIALLANLKPAKIRGLESQGMVLAIDLPDEKLGLVDPDGHAAGVELTFGELESVPKSKLSIKDYDKAAVTVQGGAIVSGAHKLGAAGKAIPATAPDGAPVR